MQRDTLYAKPQKSVGDFVFDEQVVPVFSDMIRRSVPGYAEVIKMTGWLAHHYVQPDTNIFDLGCSLGDSTLSIAGSLQGRRGRIIGVDNAPEMVRSCEKNVFQAGFADRIVIRCEDVRDTMIDNASVVVLNYTMQFIAPEERLSLLQKIYEGLVPGGVLIVSEKVSFENPDTQKRMSELHYAFKRANGYSDLEISQKRAALERVLIPDTLSAHNDRFKDAGFSTTDVWYQSLNFASMLACK